MVRVRVTELAKSDKPLWNNRKRRIDSIDWRTTTVRAFLVGPTCPLLSTVVTAEYFEREAYKFLASLSRIRRHTSCTTTCDAQSTLLLQVAQSGVGSVRVKRLR